ncbi:MAG: NAD-dependent epimerase/dehydratase family protein [Clostridia bacterium]|nr:NAD-dependent epimerase/dehydratase family protein [Clostridia bacterium]NLS85021.1 NAD-dependent epimerase/dehydratase family protein [Oscillospiraceae bacterium]
MTSIYLVTGAAGHLGGVITQSLLARGESVRVLVLPNEKAVLPDGAEVFEGDVRDIDSLRGFFTASGYDKVIVLHCAGIVTIQSGLGKKVIDVNAGGTANIIRLCMEKRIDKLVYVSSVHTIKEQPEGTIIAETDIFKARDVAGIYAKTKACATAMALKAARHGLDVSVVHPSGIIGPQDTSGNNHLTKMIKDFCGGRLPAGLKGGYDFVDVRDVADGVIACAQRGKSGECYILSGHYATIKELFALLEKVSGAKAPQTYLPLPAAMLFALGAELTAKIAHKKPLYTAYSIYTLGTNARFSHEKASKELGYSPRPLEETLRDTVAWINENQT